MPSQHTQIIRQTSKLTDKQAHKQTDKYTGRQTSKLTDTEGNMQTDAELPYGKRSFEFADSVLVFGVRLSTKANHDIVKQM